MPQRLLGPDEPPPVLSLRRDGRSPVVICIDHASRRIPRSLDDLGLTPDELDRHIACDIGALGVALVAAEQLDAALIAQNYSRLVIDCNREPGAESSIPIISEYTAVPGNAGLTNADRQARRAEIFEPYHAHIRGLLDERAAAGRPTIFVSQHSMTDVFKGERRHMHAAVLYNRDARAAQVVLHALRRERQLQIAENEPYRCNEATDYTIFNHAEARGLPYVELEIRQDLIRADAGQVEWGRRIANALEELLRNFESVVRV